MKKMDLITLKKDIKLSKDVLTKGMNGIVLGEKEQLIKVLFFNPKNIGDYLIADIDSLDVILEETEVPDTYREEVLNILNKLENRQKDSFKNLGIKNYDKVELLVEKEKYSKHGVHKGSVGIVIDDNAVKDYIEVDFSFVNEKGEYCGESFAVNLKDIKVME